MLDGELFEQRFNALRRKRARYRDDESKGRPFSGMHKHFLLLSGDSWGRTGSTFRHKKTARVDEEGGVNVTPGNIVRASDELKWPEENY